MNRRPDGPELLVASRSWVWTPPLVVLALGALVVLTGADIKAFHWINDLSRYTGENFWIMLTILSDGVVSFTILLPWIRRRPQNIWAILLAGIAFTILSVLMKLVLNVRRPPNVLDEASFTLIGPGYRQHSFPSGHAAMVFSMAGVWSITVSQPWVRVVLLFFAALIALSRVVVGVHWPLDILVGAALGWMLSYLGVRIAQKTPWGYGLIAQRIMGAMMLVCAVVLFFPYCGFDQVIWEQRAMALVFLLIGLHQYRRLYRPR